MLTHVQNHTFCLLAFVSRSLYPFWLHGVYLTDILYTREFFEGTWTTGRERYWEFAYLVCLLSWYIYNSLRSSRADEMIDIKMYLFKFGGLPVWVVKLSWSIWVTRDGDLLSKCSNHTAVHLDLTVLMWERHKVNLRCHEVVVTTESDRSGR